MIRFKVGHFVMPKLLDLPKNCTDPNDTILTGHYLSCNAPLEIISIDDKSSMFGRDEIILNTICFKCKEQLQGFYSYRFVHYKKLISLRDTNE